MAMLNVVTIDAYRQIYWLRLIGLVQRSAATWRCVLHSSDEPGELSQRHRHNNSTVDVVVAITVTITVYLSICLSVCQLRATDLKKQRRRRGKKLMWTFSGFRWKLSTDRVELCACTSNRERSTRAGEACTSDRQPVNGNPDSDSCLCERSCALFVFQLRQSADSSAAMKVNAGNYAQRVQKQVISQVKSSQVAFSEPGTITQINPSHYKVAGSAG